MPRRHAYTRHIGWPGDGVERIATPDATYRASDLVDAGWVREHAEDFDCMHTHFGFGDVDLGSMREWLAALAEVGRPLVHTVHDLENPHQADQHHHRSQLDLLVPAADALITLTGCAADRVEQIWGRRPVVLPHPHIVDLDRVGEPRARPAPLVVGMHLKDLRAAVHGPELWDAVAAAVGADERFRLRIDAYPAAVERAPAARHHLDRLEAEHGVEVRLRPYGPDDDFDAYVRALDVALLPYRWGTHSGWAEACLDVGTQVVAPASTCIADQHPSIHAIDLDGPDPGAALAAVLERCWEHRHDPPLTREWRTRQRQELAAAHARIYASVTS